MIALALLMAASQPSEAEPMAEAAQAAVAAERAFAARAQSEGQWTAFRATAAPDAIMLAPAPVNAQEFLARFRTDPVVAVMWWPAHVWVSCDGNVAVTSGPWVRRGGTSAGSFTTVWRRQEDGSWRWVYDNGRELPAAIDAPDQPTVHRPYCGEQPAAIVPRLIDPPLRVQWEGRAPNEARDALTALPDAPPVAQGQSLDRSLRWEVLRLPEQGEHAYAFRVWQRTRNHQAPVLIEFHGIARPQ